MVAGLSACSSETGSSAVTTEQSITHDIKTVRGRESTSLRPAEHLEEQRQAWRQEPSAPVRPEVPFHAFVRPGKWLPTAKSG
jgi:hypothetical protein